MKEDRQKEESNKKSTSTQSAIFINIVIVILTSLIVLMIVNNPFKPVEANGAEVIQSNQIKEDGSTNLRELQVRKSEGCREFESIETHLFEVYDTETGQISKLADGELQLDKVSTQIKEFLDTSKFKVLSIGVVDNKFYIQQDTTKPIEYNVNVKIVSLKDGFTPDDWFSLTEAIYNSSSIEADSLFSYQTTIGSKHYIYVYTDSNESIITAVGTSELNK